jgi:RNA polymerase sigma-70 factor (ECF subfamily)
MARGIKDSPQSNAGPPENRIGSETESRFNSLLDTYGELLRRAIMRVCPKDLGLQFNDIEQEARIRLWRAVTSEREIRNPGSYIYRIAVSATINAIQQVKARREEQLSPAEDAGAGPDWIESRAADPGESPEALAVRSELIDKVEQALAGLQEKRRVAVGLYLKGMTTDEIAELMGWSEPKARNLAYRGLKELREAVRALGIEWEE